MVKLVVSKFISLIFPAIISSACVVETHCQFLTQNIIEAGDLFLVKLASGQCVSGATRNPPMAEPSAGEGY